MPERTIRAPSRSGSVLEVAAAAENDEGRTVHEDDAALSACINKSVELTMAYSNPLVPWAPQQSVRARMP